MTPPFLALIIHFLTSHLHCTAALSNELLWSRSPSCLICRRSFLPVHSLRRVVIAWQAQDINELRADASHGYSIRDQFLSKTSVVKSFRIASHPSHGRSPFPRQPGLASLAVALHDCSVQAFNLFKQSSNLLFIGNRFRN